MPKKKNPHKRHGATVASVLKQKRDEMHWAWEASRNTTMDFVVIALGRMGFRATRFKEFDKQLNDVWVDYGNLLHDVSKEDPELWEAKAKIDREIKLYVGEELFVPYDDRHNTNKA